MPQIYVKNIEIRRNAEIFFWHITESLDELAGLIADNGALLAEAQKRFKSISRQREWLAVRALLKQTPYNGENILYHENGMPYLTNRYMSISHTREYVAIAISKTPTGIDIEEKGRDASSAIRTFLHPQENAHNAEEALQLWVAKEAAFKIHPEKANILKKIKAQKSEEGYFITYPDGSTANCYIYDLGEIILSIV